MKPTDIDLLLAPFDTGRRDWRMGAGPRHLVARGLVARLAARGHDVRTVVIEPGESCAPGEIATAFALMARLADLVRVSVARGAFPLVLSGNCNTAPGTLAGLAPRARRVFWFDAHGDCNTPETTTTGFLDGMALAMALGWCWEALMGAVPGFVPVEPSAVLLLGTRDVDALESELMTRNGIARLRPADVGDPAALGRALAIDIPGAVGYVHLDLDVLDSSEGQANCFPVAGGLDVARVRTALDAIGRATPIVAAAVTAYAPEYDPDGRVCRAAFELIDALVPGLPTR